jgi:hypothetical protein
MQILQDSHMPSLHCKRLSRARCLAQVGAAPPDMGVCAGCAMSVVRCKVSYTQTRRAVAAAVRRHTHYGRPATCLSGLASAGWAPAAQGPAKAGEGGICPSLLAEAADLALCGVEYC